MRKEEMQFEFDVYESSEEMNEQDKELLTSARNITGKAYAPYSKFSVGAAALLNNGEVVTGTNQENASYPVGICAERVLIGTAAMLHTNIPIHTLAVSYHNANNTESSKPISPCGMCRQVLKEYEDRTNQPIRLIMSGLTGKVYILKSVSYLLPMSFGSVDLQ